METHTHSALNQFKGDSDPKNTKTRLWEEITAYLNIHGNEKNIDAWKRVRNIIFID